MLALYFQLQPWWDMGANKKPTGRRMIQEKTGRGPLPKDYTHAEELAIANNEGRPLTDEVMGNISPDPGRGGSSSPKAKFVQCMHLC